MAYLGVSHSEGHIYIGQTSLGGWNITAALKGTGGWMVEWSLWGMLSAITMNMVSVVGY